MTEKKFKKLPYGISNFSTIRKENYVYVDKTRFIEQLENESKKYHVFIRPRKFGKSLLLSMLSYYYDIRRASDFEQFFGDLYIGKNPTRRKNSYAILEFDFSGINTLSLEEFKKSFSEKIQETVLAFFAYYRDLFSDADSLINRINEKDPGIGSLNIVIEQARSNATDLFVIIDEYDHFANDLIAMGNSLGDDVYRNMVRANGLVRDFYEILKTGSKSSIDRIFITGVSPVMLDDMTSGFNIADNLTTKMRYNEMMGFTQAETDAVMAETGVDPALIHLDMSLYYNGYLFNGAAKNRLYNPSMVLYYFDLILHEENLSANIIDSNLKTDYGRLKRLIQSEENRDTIIQIAKEGSIVSKIIEKFSMDLMFNDEYFISLLFYMGLITIKESQKGRVRLCIPNYSIETVYWEYIRKLTEESSPQMTVNTQLLNEAIEAMAFDGDLHHYIDYVSQNAFSKLSDKDLKHFDEKYIKVMLLSYLFMSDLYVVMSEYETGMGYTDIFLQRHPQQPEVKYEWVLELKYLKTGDERHVPDARAEAEEQLQRYIRAYRLQGRPNMKTAIVVFIGKNKYEIF